MKNITGENWQLHEKNAITSNTKPYGSSIYSSWKKHDVYRQPATKIETTIPRHDEVKEFTAKSIIKTLSPIDNEWN